MYNTILPFNLKLHSKWLKSRKNFNDELKTKLKIIKPKEEYFEVQKILSIWKFKICWNKSTSFNKLLTLSKNELKIRLNSQFWIISKIFKCPSNFIYKNTFSIIWLRSKFNTVQSQMNILSISSFTTSTKLLFQKTRN